MASELRNTGISVVGEIAWGAHFCHFYETKEDLLDILIPYFKAGLENNEFCIWVVSDPLGEEEARNTLRESVPDADRRLAAGDIEIVPLDASRQPTFSAANIEIIPHTNWYLENGAFIAERVLNGWNQKLADALAKGYAGLRANGNEAWLTEENWKAFSEYEKTLDENLGSQRMIVLCSYPLSGSGAAQILDVVNTHQLAVVRRNREWELIEAPEFKQTKIEIKRLNEELTQRVIERTRELAATNEALQAEILQRQLAEDRLRLVIDMIPAMVFTALPDGSVDYVNQRWLQYMGLTLEDVRGWGWDHTIHPEDRARSLDHWRSTMMAGEPSENELRVRRADGIYRWILGRFVPLRDETGKIVRWYGVSTDVDDRRRAEEQLEARNQQLRALSASLQSAREQESKRIAREIHDELGSSLTSLRWDLEGVAEIISKSEGVSRLGELLKRIEAMLRLTDAAVNTVRRISSELRPQALDQLGIVEAIEWQARQFEARTGIISQCDCYAENIQLTAEQSTAVFRILQEALTNILRHAQATQVEIKIQEEGGEFVLTIKDNGRGITDSEKSGLQSLGILGMRERAHLIGGEASISGIEGQGTMITVRVPLPPAPRITL